MIKRIKKYWKKYKKYKRKSKFRRGYKGKYRRYKYKFKRAMIKALANRPKPETKFYKLANLFLKVDANTTSLTYSTLLFNVEPYIY